MSKIYTSAVPLTMVRTVDGGYRNVFQDEAISGDSVDSANLKRLVRKGFLVEEKSAGKPVKAAPTGPNPGTAEFVLAEVGDDKGKAQVALDEETARETPRKTLVADLEKILAA